MVMVMVMVMVVVVRERTSEAWVYMYTAVEVRHAWCVVRLSAQDPRVAGSTWTRCARTCTISMRWNDRSLSVTRTRSFKSPCVVEDTARGEVRERRDVSGVRGGVG